MSNDNILQTIVLVFLLMAMTADNINLIADTEENIIQACQSEVINNEQ